MKSLPNQLKASGPDRVRYSAQERDWSHHKKVIDQQTE